MKLFGASISEFGGAMIIGAGVVLLAPVVIPIVASVMKPLAKAAIKGGILAYEGAKVAVAEAKEAVEDIAAEAKAELAESQKRPEKALAKKAAA